MSVSRLGHTRAAALDARGRAHHAHEVCAHRRARATWVGVIFAGAALACAPEPAAPPEAEIGWDIEEDPPESLLSTGLLSWDGQAFSYPEGVMPYALATALFSDYALKERALFVPEGTTGTFSESGVFDLPVGTVLLKSFLFPADFRAPSEDLRLIETRVLVRYADEWRAYPYLWTDDGSDAVLHVGGAQFPIEFIDRDGATKIAQYLVPQRNQCLACHELKDDADERYVTPIGPSARNLNRPGIHAYTGQNQLELLSELGWLAGVADPSTVDAAFEIDELDGLDVDALSPEALVTAARDYLDVNCAHCHNPAGVNGISSQLFLNYDNDSEFNLGVCKKPGSAGTGAGGLDYDIVPGNPDESILVFRMETEEVGAMMPLLGRSLRHDDGVELVRAWIAGMEPVVCMEE